MTVDAAAKRPAKSKTATNSSKSDTKSESATYPALDLDVVVAAKKTVMTDWRFDSFRGSYDPVLGYRTSTLFLVNRQDIDDAKAVIIARVYFSVPSSDGEFPLQTGCTPPNSKSKINGIAWLLSDDGLQILRSSPIWGSFSCFGTLSRPE